MMPEIPDRMKRFPLWMDRYPIHFTVAIENGVPLFNQVSRLRQLEAAAKNLCHLCGQRLLAPYYFICSERDVKDKACKDGPMHLECAMYAIKACPFLANPDYTGKRPAIQDAGPSTAAALIAMDATGPVVRPSRIALCTANSYCLEDKKSQYPLFIVPDWLTVDWSVIPSKS